MNNPHPPVHRATIRHEARKFLVWRLVKSHRGNITSDDIARQLGISKSTVLNCLGELKVARKIVAPAETREVSTTGFFPVDRYFREHGAV
jgi:predicted transcriptional regulator